MYIFHVVPWSTARLWHSSPMNKWCKDMFWHGKKGIIRAQEGHFHIIISAAILEHCACITWAWYSLVTTLSFYARNIWPILLNNPQLRTVIATKYTSVFWKFLSRPSKELLIISQIFLWPYGVDTKQFLLGNVFILYQSVSTGVLGVVELTEGWWANFSSLQTAGGLSDMHHERYFGRSMQAADRPSLSSCPWKLYAPTTANIKKMWTHY